MNELDRNVMEELAYGMEQDKLDQEWQEFCKSTYLSEYEKELLKIKAEKEPIPVIPKPIAKLTDEELQIGYSEYVEWKRFGKFDL